MQSFHPENFNNNSTILLDKIVQPNGRINIMDGEPANPNLRFQMQERIAVKNKTTEYREALTGTWENNTISQLFFSKENIQIIQNAIRAGVYKMSGNTIVVAPQNIDTIKIVMRSTYLQHVEHRPENITEQIEKLNKIVLDYCVPTLYNESMGYHKYLEDASSMYKPMEIPRHHDRNYKQLILKQWF
jgi:hypothetical protein